MSQATYFAWGLQDVSCPEKMVLLALAGESGSSNGDLITAAPSVSYLAAKTSMNRTAVIRILNRLADRDKIRRTGKTREGQRVYLLLFALVAQSDGVVAQGDGHPSHRATGLVAQGDTSNKKTYISNSGAAGGVGSAGVGDKFSAFTQWANDYAEGTGQPIGGQTQRQAAEHAFGVNVSVAGDLVALGAATANYCRMVRKTGRFVFAAATFLQCWRDWENYREVKSWKRGKEAAEPLARGSVDECLGQHGLPWVPAKHVCVCGVIFDCENKNCDLPKEAKGLCSVCRPIFSRAARQ